MRCLLIFLYASAVFAGALLQGQTRHTGAIDGADYIIDVPDAPTGRVVFLARGFRPDFFPLSAVYEVGTDYYQTLLADGWTIASTAFQTNDWVVAEGGADILALQAFVAENIHPIERSILYGETMGGGVAVWLAENHPERFDGVLCLGAHLGLAPDDAAFRPDQLAPLFSGQPEIPIVFLANGDEMVSSQQYIERAQNSSLPPVSWYVERPGHVNVNSAERLSAFRALIDWIGGERPGDVADGTITMDPESTAAIEGSRAAAQIRLLRPLYGNIYTSFTPDDLAQLGIDIRDQFTLTHRKQSHPVTFARAYSDVPYGAWVGFIDPEGYLQISRNYANAAETLGAAAGDTLLISAAE